MHRVSREDLASFFRPRNVALIGASDRSFWSQSVFARFQDYGHVGEIFAVNLKGTTAHGLKGYQRVADIPAKVDTAIIYVPAAGVIGALQEAAAAGVRNAVVLSSGYAESGAEGVVLQAELTAAAAAAGVNMLGPNSLGFANFAGSCFCTVIRTRLPVRPGRLAIVSQSGALGNELAKWAYAQGIGLSFLCATGNEAQIGIADIVDYLVDDPASSAIALYVEGINDPERFMAAAARAQAAKKPIVMLKLGRSEESTAVALAHTGTLVGDDRATDAMCRRYGVTRANSIEELITTADFLGNVGPINPPRIGMASISGGACGMYADLAQTHGLAITQYAPETQAALREILPDFAGSLNPLDVTGVAIQNVGLWTETVPVLLRDPGMGLIVVSNSFPNTEEEVKIQGGAFAAVAEGFRNAGKPPVILSFSMQDTDPTQLQLRKEIGTDIVLPGIEMGVRALAHLQRWSEGLLLQAERAAPAAAGDVKRPQSEREVLDHLATYGVPVIPARVARSADEAAAFAEALGGKIALKILSPDIAHKTEAGGVRLNLQGAAEIRLGFEEIMRSAKAYAPAALLEGVIVSPMREAGIELIVGVARDPQWGLVIVAGLGGVFTEVLKDSQVRLLPVTQAEARGMLQELRGAKLLQGFRGAPAADLDRLADIITRIGDAALALGPELAALEVNPLWVRGDQAECLDGLAVYSA